MNYIQKHFAKIISNLNNSINSNNIPLKSSFASNASDEPINCHRVYYNANNSEKNVIICLKIYESDLINSYFITPQILFLLYDLTSKKSFTHLMEYYNAFKNDKKYSNVKFVLIGNKNDLIHEDHKNEEEKEEEKEELEKVMNGKKEEKKEEEKQEKKDENEEKKEKEVKNEENIKENQDENENSKNIKNDGTIKDNKEYFKSIIDNEKFEIVKEISGLNGYGLADLFNEVITELYIEIENIETSTKELDGLEESHYFEGDLDIERKRSYYDIAYKKEIHKINRIKNKSRVCLNCEIY